jgi:hypothetical protein
MQVENLIKSWSFPDRSSEKVSVSLRLPYDVYASLHALKEVYSDQSVNDIARDLLRAAIAEVVEALPSYIGTEESYDEERNSGVPDEYCVSVGEKYGPRPTYEAKYRELLKTKLEDKGLRVIEKEEAA